MSRNWLCSARPSTHCWTRHAVITRMPCAPHCTPSTHPSISHKKGQTGTKDGFPPSPKAPLRGAPHIEEHLASWTKGCEGPTYSGVLKRNARGEGQNFARRTANVPH